MSSKFYLFCRNQDFINFHSFYISLQINSLHFTLNRIKYEKQILLPVEFEPTTSCIRVKRLPARPLGLRPLWPNGKTLDSNTGGRGFESHREQNLFCLFLHLLYLEWNVNCFVKLI